MGRAFSSEWWKGNSGKAIAAGILLILPLGVFLLDVDPGVLAGCGTYGYGCSYPACLAVEVTTNGGYTWQRGSAWVSVTPGTEIRLYLRVALTTTVTGVEGWSLGVRHFAGSLEAAGGEFEVVAAAAGPDLETVKGGAPADFSATRPWTCGVTQGVVIDMGGTGVKLGPRTNFFALEACYRLRFPYGHYQVHAVKLEFHDDVGVPPVETLVVRNGGTIVPCEDALTIYVQPYGYPTPSYCPLSPMYLSACEEDRGEGLAGGGEPSAWGPSVSGAPGTDSGGVPLGPDSPRDSDAWPLPTPPLSLGDANGDNRLNITDAIAVLRYLFQGTGDLPKVAMLLQTGQTQCFEGAEEVDCGQIGEGANYWGQDAHYGSGRIRRFVIDGPPGSQTVKDLATGLMWERDPGRIAVGWAGAQGVIEARNQGHSCGYSDWRLPTITELLTICEYAYSSGNPWEGGATARCGAEPCFQLGTGPQDTFPAAAWSSTEYGLARGEQGELTHAWWLWIPDGTMQPAAKTNERGVIAVRTWHPEAPHEGEEAEGVPTDYQLGDADGNGTLNITDAIYALNYLFLSSGQAPKLVVPRPVPPVSIDPARFELDEEDGTVDDNLTGLTWVRGPESFPEGGTADWEDALVRSEALFWPNRQGGHEDWRLPNVFEQVSLVDFSRRLGEGEERVSVFPPEFEIDPEAEPPLQTSTTAVRVPQNQWKVVPNNALDGLFRYGGALHDQPAGYGEKLLLCYFLPVRGPD